MSADAAAVRRGKASAVAAIWVAGSAYVAWSLGVEVVWGLPAAAALACACCLALGLWPQALPARWMQSLLWIALFCFALVPPIYTAIASAANARFPERFMCDAGGGRMARCGMIGIEALAVPCVVLAAAVVCRLCWRDAGVERAATAVALAWLAAVTI